MFDFCIQCWTPLKMPARYDPSKHFPCCSQHCMDMENHFQSRFRDENYVFNGQQVAPNPVRR